MRSNENENGPLSSVSTGGPGHLPCLSPRGKGTHRAVGGGAAATSSHQGVPRSTQPGKSRMGVQVVNWSEQLANATGRLARYQRDKMGCEFANLTAGKYGANQIWARGVAVTPSMAVGEWVKQRQFYNHTDNSCVANHKCGVYTQVVWRKSTEVGCAKEQAYLTICFCDPPGNVVGESPY